MKNAFWAYWLILLGVLIVVIMLLVRNLTTTSTQDYYLVKEITNAALVDAVDYSYYRNYGELRINKEKFYESFLRRFAETANLSTTYTISFYGVYEAPPKVSVEIRSKSNSFTVAGDSTSFDMVERIDSILEGKPLPKVTSDLTEIEEITTPTTPTPSNPTEDEKCKKLEDVKGGSYNGLSYKLYASNNADTCAQIILYLHGGAKESGIERFASRGSGNFVMIEPRKTSSGSWEKYLGAITAIIDEVKKDYNINADKVIVTGVSDGAHGSLLFASQYSDLVSAVYAVAGSSDPIQKSSSLTGYKKVDLSKIKASVRMAVGEKDGYYALMYNDLVELQNNGRKVHMNSVPNVEHDLDGLSSFIFQKKDFDCMLNPSNSSCYGTVSTNCDGDPSNYELRGMNGTAMVDGLKVYKSSSLSGNSIKTLTPGEEIFSIVGETGNKWQIIVDGKCGWVDSDKVAINLKEYLDEIAVINITNATKSIFKAHDDTVPDLTGKALYSSEFKEFVPATYSFAVKLKNAAKKAYSDGYKLEINEAYRPATVSQYMYEKLTAYQSTLLGNYATTGICTDDCLKASTYWGADIGNYVMPVRSNSTDFSKHNMGCAVDITIQGLKMPTKMHDVTSYAKEMNENSNTLENYMKNAGLARISTEWWHYEDITCYNTIKAANGGPLDFWYNNALK